MLSISTFFSSQFSHSRLNLSFKLNANCAFNEVRSHCLVPCVVHRCAAVDVRCTGVCTVHHQQLSLQDLSCLCCHMEWGGAFLLEGQVDTQTVMTRGLA